MPDILSAIRDFVNYRILNKDRVYSQVKKGNEYLYQEYFLMALKSSDINNLTSYRIGKQPFDGEKAKADYAMADQIFMEAKEKYGLLPGVLQIMFEQYIMADPWMRESDQTNWIFRVMHRKDVDIFPDAVKVHNILFK